MGNRWGLVRSEYFEADISSLAVDRRTHMIWFSSLATWWTRERKQRKNVCVFVRCGGCCWVFPLSSLSFLIVLDRFCNVGQEDEQAEGIKIVTSNMFSLFIEAVPAQQVYIKTSKATARTHTVLRHLKFKQESRFRKLANRFDGNYLFCFFYSHDLYY